MQHLKTEKCVICGNTAKMWHGYVIAKDKMALGNYIDKKVIAGFCDKHSEILCSGQDGNYGCYNSELMGKCIPLEKLNQLIRGWINYFKIGNMKTLCKQLDSNIRYRLRMCIWKQWKTPQNRAKNLIKLGINKYTAWKVAYAGDRIAYVCNKGAVNVAISNERLTRFGLVSMMDYYAERCVTC